MGRRVGFALAGLLLALSVSVVVAVLVATRASLRALESAVRDELRDGSTSTSSPSSMSFTGFTHDDVAMLEGALPDRTGIEIAERHLGSSHADVRVGPQSETFCCEVVARFAARLAGSGDARGTELFGAACDRVSVLVVTRSLYPYQLRSIERSLNALEPVAGAMPHPIRDRRVRVLEKLLAASDGAWAQRRPLLWARVAFAWRRCDALLREAEPATHESGEGRIPERLVAAAAAWRSASFAPLANEIGLPPAERLFLQQPSARARLALARAATAVARYQTERGRLPEALAETGALPMDPFGAGRISYGVAPSGATARVWSFGPDLDDDAGDPTGDIVVDIPGPGR